MTTSKKRLLGRDAGSILESGPSYILDDGKLIYELGEVKKEMNPTEAIAELQAKNKRLAAEAQTKADNGDWSMMARQKAREQLIEAITEAFSLERN